MLLVLVAATMLAAGSLGGGGGVCRVGGVGARGVESELNEVGELGVRLREVSLGSGGWLCLLKWLSTAVDESVQRCKC